MKDRRDFLKQLGTGLAMTALAPLTPLLFSRNSARAAYATGQLSSKPKVAIIGGGIGGVATAWLLDQAAEVHLFESSSKIGGHAMTRPMNYKGESVNVDIGAQYFSPISYPGYCKILETVGLYSPTNSNIGSAISVAASLTVFKNRNEHPQFIAPQAHSRIWPIFDPLNFSGLNAFDVSLNHAKKLTETGNWNVTLGEFLESLSLTHHQKYEILAPYLCAAIGCVTSEGLKLSALSVLFYVTQSLGPGLIPSPIYLNSKIGLQGSLETIASNCSSTQIHTQASIVKIAPLGGRYRVFLQDGNSMDVDHVVMACPPVVSKELLMGLPTAQSQVDSLNKFQTFPARIVIHEDPVYVPKRRRFWSSVNTQYTETHSESSMWFGAMRPKMKDGSTMDIFKSWAQDRETESNAIVFDQRFHHFLTSPDMVTATHKLSNAQGRNGIWFAGAYMGGPVNHETATQSAIQVARGIAPDAPHLSVF